MGSHAVISSWGFLLSNLLQKKSLFSEGLFIFLGFFLKTNKKSYPTWYRVFWYWKAPVLSTSNVWWQWILEGIYIWPFEQNISKNEKTRSVCLLSLLLTSTSEFKFIKGSFYHYLLQFLTHFQKGFGELLKDLLEKAGSWSSCEGCPCNLIAWPFLAPSAWLEQDSKLFAASVILN